MYDSAIVQMSLSPFLSADIAAYWLIVGADMMPNWCIFSIYSMICAGPQAKPKRQPVIAYDLEKPLITIVRSSIPGSEAMLTCRSLYESSLYISSEMTSRSCLTMIGTSFSRSSRSMIAPVGLFG